MTEVRANELVKGDVLMLKGDRWTVVKAKHRGKHVHLVIDGRRGTFDSDVKARTVYERVDHVPPTRKVKPAKTPVDVKPDSRVFVSVEETERAWGDPVSKNEAKLIDRLGAKLVAVEDADGRLLVPPVDVTTIFGHLLTMHGVRWDGVSYTEARAWVKANDPGGEASASEVMDRLSVSRAFEVHEELHKDLTGLRVPHWHREKVLA